MDVIVVGYTTDFNLSYHTNLGVAGGAARFSSTLVSIVGFSSGSGAARVEANDFDGDGLVDVAYFMTPDPNVEWVGCVVLHCVLQPLATS